MQCQAVNPIEARDISRRQFLKAAIAGGTLIALSPLLSHPAYAALESCPARRIALNNLHTGEQLAITYWENGAYVPEALAAANRLLRDYRTGDQYPIDPALLDLLAALHQRLETTAPFEVISGYRSPKTNTTLRTHSNGVAKHSLHMEGKAMDVRIANRSLDNVHKTALAVGLGGVGYYPSSNFVHVDTGRVRQWYGA